MNNDNSEVKYCRTNGISNMKEFLRDVSNQHTNKSKTSKKYLTRKSKIVVLCLTNKIQISDHRTTSLRGVQNRNKTCYYSVIPSNENDQNPTVSRAQGRELSELKCYVIKLISYSYPLHVRHVRSALCQQHLNSNT